MPGEWAYSLIVPLVPTSADLHCVPPFHVLTRALVTCLCQAFGHLAPTWLDGEDGAEHEAAVMLYNVEDGRQGVDGIKEVVRGDDGGHGFREEDRIEGLEDKEAVRDEIQRTSSDARVLEGEREKWRVTLSRPR